MTIKSESLEVQSQHLYLKCSPGPVKDRESLPQKNSLVRIQIFSVVLSARPSPGMDGREQLKSLGTEAREGWR